MSTTSEAKAEDTESLSSTATSDTSSKNPRSDTFQSKAKSRAVKNPASLHQARSVGQMIDIIVKLAKLRRLLGRFKFYVLYIFDIFLSCFNLCFTCPLRSHISSVNLFIN